jgi:hypothetical protein
MTEERLSIDPWSLTRAERAAISRLALKAEPVENLLGVGHVTMQKLVDSGIVVTVGSDQYDRPIYGITDSGKLIFDALARSGRVVR